VVLLAMTAVSLGWAGDGNHGGGNDGDHGDQCGGEGDFDFVLPLEATTVATGIPGAGAITQIGTMHRGNPVHDNAALNPFIAPGKVMDMKRLFVASTQQFGAPIARADELPGSILSLDVSAGAVSVPANFATAGGQASAAGGSVVLYTANSPAFFNSLHNPAAVTGNEVGASFPLGISINNGGGRPWVANAIHGATGDSTISVLDPQGYGLSGGPDPVAGGEFFGMATQRVAGVGHGLTSPAIATALLFRSPDGSHRAVFLAAMADGSISQIHVQKGISDLLPPGTFTALTNVTPSAAESTDKDAVTRIGMVFNWVPNQVVYLTDPMANRVLAVDLSNDGTLFTVIGVRVLSSSHWLNRPTDLVATVPEVSQRNFASNTTLGGGSDLYVLNRGNNTIVRLGQDGSLKGVRSIATDQSGFRANGIAVSDDARTLWVSGTTPGGGGAVLSMSAFGQGFVTPQLISHAVGAGANHAGPQGADMFALSFGPAQGLGPLFNGQSCAACHNAPFNGGEGDAAIAIETRVARLIHGGQDDLGGHDGPVARQFSISSLGVPCGLQTGVPNQANASELRAAQTLRGTSLIDNIVDADIIPHAAAEPVAVRGRPNLMPDGRVGRFGWKAQTSTLVEFMGDAMRTEMGVTNPLGEKDEVNGCGANILKPEADATMLTSLVSFLETVDPPAPTAACLASAGATVFTNAGCASCHAPTLPGPGNLIQVPLYSDVLLHDMGPGLAESFGQGGASASEFRTAPLWRVADRNHFLHDGRASNIPDAINAHGGQGAAAAAAFHGLSAADRQALLDFLNCI